MRLEAKKKPGPPKPLQCIHCGCTQDRACQDAFGDPCYWVRTSKLGIGICSECEGKVTLAQWTKARKLEQTRAWRRRYPEKYQAQLDRARSGAASRYCRLKSDPEFREKLKKSRDRWAERNPGRIQQAKTRWRKKRPEYQHDYYLRHREEIRAKHRAYYQAHRPEAAESDRRKRERMKLERMVSLESRLDFKRRTAPQKTQRVCLKCDREFLSEGKFNRICPACRKSNALVVTINANAGIDVPEVPVAQSWGGRMG